MSVNIYSIHIQTNKIEEVQDALTNWLSTTHRKEVVTSVEQDSPSSFFDEEIPSLFAISKAEEENWIWILHNASEPPFMIADLLSDTCASTVIQAMGQSTVDYYSLSVHEEGKIKRRIFCFHEETLGVEKEGEEFPFEKLLDGKDNDFFNYDDMYDFCLHFGIDILTDPDENDGEWTIIQVKE